MIEPEKFRIIPTKINITFNDENGFVIGVFEENNGKLTFEGSVDESAEMFVDFICNGFNCRINELIKKEAENIVRSRETRNY